MHFYVPGAIGSTGGLGLEKLYPWIAFYRKVYTDTKNPENKNNK